MKDKQPRWVDDGLVVYRNATVYICDAEDTRMEGYDIHLDIAEDGTFDHIMFDNTATLYDRGTLREAWEDAADWLHETAQALQGLESWIRSDVLTRDLEGGDE